MAWFRLGKKKKKEAEKQAREKAESAPDEGAAEEAEDQADDGEDAPALPPADQTAEESGEQTTDGGTAPEDETQDAAVPDEDETRDDEEPEEDQDPAEDSDLEPPSAEDEPGTDLPSPVEELPAVEEDRAGSGDDGRDERDEERDDERQEDDETPDSADEPAGAEADRDRPKKKKGLFSRFRERLTKTRSSFSGRLEAVFSGGGKIDEDLLEEMEEILITSDMGVDVTNDLLAKLRKKIKRRNLTDPRDLKSALADSLMELFDNDFQAPEKPFDGPEVILIVGVNGVGKTTTIGKLARRYANDGKKVLLAAGDTFRAAAGEQLEIWAERVGADIVRHLAGADPSAVVFDAVEAAQARGADVVLVDTAGRLHTKVNLMEELKKIRRVMAKKIPDAPHQTILILDATTGQNALSQARLFHEATPLTGLILTKLDGTAKGGIVAAVAHQIQRPVLFVGLGEQMDDLRTFDPRAFVEAIL